MEARYKIAVLAALALGYIVTGVFAPSHIRQWLKQDALARWEAGVESDKQRHHMRRQVLIELGFDPDVEEYESRVLPSGPHCGLNWCVPLLPGLSLANDYYVIGPLWGAGHLSLYVHYGFGVARIAAMRTWTS